MTITEMIERLEEVKKAHGDLECNVLDPEAYGTGEIISTTAFICIDEDNTCSPIGLTFIDREAAESFS